MFVYIDVRYDTNSVFYVGQGGPARCNCYHPNARNKQHARIVAKHGMIRFVVFSDDTFEMLEGKNGKILRKYPLIDAKEIELIAQFNTYHHENPKGCNYDRGGHCPRGRKTTEETRAKQRANKLGKKRKPHTVKSRAKIRTKLMNHDVTNETKSKISKVSKGRPRPHPTLCIPVTQHALDGTYIATFKSCLHAHKVTGISNGNISGVIRGLRSHAGGYLWHQVTSGTLQS